MKVSKTVIMFHQTPLLVSGQEVPFVLVVIDSGYTYTNPTDIKQGKKAPFDLSTLGNAGKIKTFSVNTESNEYAMISQIGNKSSGD